MAYIFLGHHVLPPLLCMFVYLWKLRVIMAGWHWNINNFKNNYKNMFFPGTRGLGRIRSHDYSFIKLVWRYCGALAYRIFRFARQKLIVRRLMEARGRRTPPLLDFWSATFSRFVTAVHCSSFPRSIGKSLYAASNAFFVNFSVNNKFSLRFITSAWRM